MPAGNVSSIIAAEHEYMTQDLPQLYPLMNRFWARLQTKTNVDAISNRPARIALETAPNNKFRQVGLDGGDLGRGGAPSTIYGNLSCVAFGQASEYTALSEFSSDSSAKSIKDYVSLTHKRALQQYGHNMDAILQGDGSNTLDTVTSVSGNAIVVANPNQFVIGCDYDIWSALGGTNRGTFTVSAIDANAVTIYSLTTPPSGTTAGDLILVNGSAGVAASGLYGIRYYLVNGNTGTYMGIPRSGYPGEFSTPSIAVNGPLTPAVVRAIEAQIEFAMGIDRADESDLVGHCNVDVRAQWEDNALNVQSILRNEVKLDESYDMLPKKAAMTIGGRELMINEKAKQGYLDFIGFKNWFRLETRKFGMYDVAGQTLFPAYGSTGGIATSMMFYYIIMAQVGCLEPRLNAYGSGITVSKGYFGH